MIKNEDLLRLHAKQTGELEIKPTMVVDNREELGEAYTPGVAVIAKMIADHENLKAKYTISGKLVAVVTDGSAVLGLGNIGPSAGLPIVEGKALLYKRFSGVDAIPMAIDQMNVDEFCQTIKHISKSFAGIHLEDIAAPKCFAIEQKLQEELDIPVYHDDQEGTAIVVLAGLINAAKVVGKSLKDLHVVINGIGASGVATGRILFAAGLKHLIFVDKFGVVTANDMRYNAYQRELVKRSDVETDMLKDAPLSKVIDQQDVFIGLSVADVLKKTDVQKMADKPIVFALANPVPEILPEAAAKAGAAVIATGSSKYPNQVNNVLAFPGTFKGLIATGLKKVDGALEVAIAHGLAGMIAQPTSEKIIPSVFEPHVADQVYQAVQNYAKTAKK